MRRALPSLAWLAAAALTAGCSRAAPSTDLTNGVAAPLTSCPYTFTTPAQTTAPIADDGFVGATPAVRNVHLAWVGDPTSSMVVTWATDFDTTGTQLELGADASYGQKFSGFSFAYPTDLDGTDPPSVRIHQVHLCGLTPGATYHYRVGAGAAVSSDATFSTAPANPASVRVLVGGDSRGNTAEWGRVLAAGASEQPDFAIFTGDAIDLGTIQDEWESWFASGASVLPNLPLMLAEGNHEINSRHYFSQFPLPANQQWYDFDYGDLHFVVLNDTPVDDSSIAGEEATFLTKSLSSTTKPFKIVVHHKPPYTSSTGHPPDAELQAAWSPIYDAQGVDLVLNGHAHDYERSYPIKAGQVVADGQGPVYIVQGGGGADPYTVAQQSFTAFGVTSFGYLRLDLAGRTLTVTAKADDGSTIDSYVIAK